jgi:hypothetical protein
MQARPARCGSRTAWLRAAMGMLADGRPVTRLGRLHMATAHPGFNRNAGVRSAACFDDLAWSARSRI